MTGETALSALAEHLGILPSYSDLSGHTRWTNPDTQRALLRANGLTIDTDDMIAELLQDLQAREADRWFPEEIVVQSNAAVALEFGLGTTWHVVCTETGACLAEGRAGDRIELPPLPSGVYDLVASTRERAETITVLVAPGHLPSIHDRTGIDRLWGVNAALYGLGADRKTGLGDFEALAEFGEVAGKAGAGFFGINPVHAFGSRATEVISPYSPSSRSALNTLHIALDRIPGLAGSNAAKEIALGARIAASVTSDAIDYPGYKARHGAALSRLYDCFCDHAEEIEKAGFKAFQAGITLHEPDFALFEALSEDHGADWRVWPAELQVANQVAVGRTAAVKPDRVSYHRWLQWVADRQLANAQDRLVGAGMTLGLYLDLAVGARRGGAESWCEAGSIATGISVGAPPDHLSPEGQNWDLAAFAPQKLRTRKYAAIRRILRSALAHTGVLRIDHVLGLKRSFWIPDDGSPGAYIASPFQALTAIIRIEAERANAIIIGEDLGLLPPGFRDTMRGQGFYGYSVLQYERNDHGGFRDPQSYDPRILACFGTHDTPTVYGFQKGWDIDWWQKLGWISESDAEDAHRNRASDVQLAAAIDADDEGLHDSDPEARFSRSVHRALANSPAALVSVQLDDILGNVDAQNLPGTIDQYPNWRRQYATTPDLLANEPGLISISKWMRQGGRTPPGTLAEENLDEH